MKTRVDSAANGDKEVFVSAGMMSFVGSMTAMGFVIDDAGLTYVRDWFRFYCGWRGRRVVGFREPQDIAVKLIADSFSFQAVPDFADRPRVLDIGSANGWPGLAVRLCTAGSTLTLLDSRLGACEFMRALLAANPLAGTSVSEGRAEEVAKCAGSFASYDVAVTRAMAEPAIALELTSPFVKVGGVALLWLGPEQEERVIGAPKVVKIGMEIAGVYKYSLPSGLGRRVLAAYTKTSATQRGSIRPFSNILKNPLF